MAEKHTSVLTVRMVRSIYQRAKSAAHKRETSLNQFALLAIIRAINEVEDVQVQKLLPFTQGETNATETSSNGP